MSRTAAPFRQHDVTRALRAVGAAGYEVTRLEINPDGKIILVIAELPDAAPKRDSAEVVL
jgi:hypothetical protein